MKVLVVIPTYNEVQALEPIVSRVRTSVPDADILVVDDDSPDGTGDLADRIAEDDGTVHVLHRAGKEGLGKAYLAAFDWAMGRDYTHVVQMDADGSHRPEELPLLLERAGMSDYPDLIIGSRYVRGGEMVGWPKSREILSRAGNFYIKAWLGIPASDVTAGYRVYRTGFLRRIDFTSVESSGYFFQTDMTDKLNDEQKKAIADQIPLAKLGRVEDIADAVAYLARAEYITGETLNINGGMYML